MGKPNSSRPSTPRAQTETKAATPTSTTPVDTQAPATPETPTEQTTTTVSTAPEQATAQATIAAAAAMSVTSLADVEEVAIPTVEDYFKSKYGIDLANPPKGFDHIVERIEDYAAKMGNTCIMDDVQGRQYQKRLFVTYEKALLGLDSPFNFAAMDYILMVINRENKGAFRQEMVTRFTKNTMWSHEDTLMFNALNALFIQIADPVTRASQLSMLNVPAIVARFPSERINITNGLLDYLNHSR